MKRLLFLVLLLPLFVRADEVAVPPRASQAEVNAGLNNYKYITPATLAGFSLSTPTNGVTPAQATNITIGYAIVGTNKFIGDLTGSTNVFNSPTTLWVNTNASGTGIRGQFSAPFSTLSGAINASKFGDTIKIIGNVVLTSPVVATNLTIEGGTIYCGSFASVTPAVMLDGSTLRGVIVSNSAAPNTFSAVVGGTNYAGATIESCSVYGPDFGIQFFIPFGAPTNLVIIKNTYVNSNLGVDMWRMAYKLIGCRFDCSNSCLSFNDFSTNDVSNCSFTVGPTSGIVGVNHFGGSYTEIKNSSFSFAQGTPSDALMVSCAENAIAFYQNCSFSLSGNLTSLKPNQLAAFTGEAFDLRLQNCTYLPWTNGVIFGNLNSLHKVRVTGGNFSIPNFSLPTRVVWGTSTFDTVTTTNLNFNGTTLFDLSQDVLFSSDTTASIDCANRDLFDSGTVLSLEYQNRFLDDSLGNTTVDWGSRILSGGTWKVNGNFNVVGGIITNNGIVWTSGATATNTATYPNGSIATAGGNLWVLLSGVWNKVQPTSTGGGTIYTTNYSSGLWYTNPYSTPITITLTASQSANGSAAGETDLWIPGSWTNAFAILDSPNSQLTLSGVLCGTVPANAGFTITNVTYAGGAGAQSTISPTQVWVH